MGEAIDRDGAIAALEKVYNERDDFFAAPADAVERALRALPAAPAAAAEVATLVELGRPIGPCCFPGRGCWPACAPSNWEAVKRENQRAIDAEDKVRAAEAERDALRAAVVAPCDRCGHGKSADWKALEMDLRGERESHRLEKEERERNWAERNTARAELTAERAAHEETRRKLEAAEARAAEAHTRLQVLADERFGYGPTEPVEKLITKIERGIAEMTTLEAAPDLGEAFVEECAQAAYSAHFGNAPMRVGETRPAWRAGARAVLEMAAKRWGRAALSVAIGDLGTGPSVSPEPENRGPIVEAAPPIVAAWLEDSRRFPNSGSRSLEVWLAESIDRLDAEVRRIGGGR